MSFVMTEISSVVSAATLATVNIICFTSLTATFMITAYYLGKPLGHVVLRCAFIAAGQKDTPITDREARVLASLLIVPFVLIDMTWKTALDEKPTSTSEPWLGSPALTFIGSMYLRAGLEVTLTISLLSAFVAVGRASLRASAHTREDVKNSRYV
jgi:hypothetical protein